MKQAEVQEPKRTMGAKLAVQIPVTDSPHWSQKIALNQSCHQPAQEIIMGQFIIKLNDSSYLQDLDLCLQYIDRVTYFYY